jgi:hypothetical protein
MATLWVPLRSARRLIWSMVQLSGRLSARQRSRRASWPGLQADPAVAGSATLTERQGFPRHRCPARRRRGPLPLVARRLPRQAGLRCPRPSRVRCREALPEGWFVRRLRRARWVQLELRPGWSKSPATASNPAWARCAGTPMAAIAPPPSCRSRRTPRWFCRCAERGGCRHHRPRSSTMTHAGIGPAGLARLCTRRCASTARGGTRAPA